MAFEYQKDIKKNLQYGILLDHSRNFGFISTGYLGNLNTNLTQLSINGYYKLNLIKDKLFWAGGVGVGAVYVNWDDRNRVGATVNASLTLNLKLSKRVYLEASPLIVVAPTNRLYYSPIKIDEYRSLYAATVFPFGLKVKL